MMLKLKNEDVILVANSSNDQGAHSSQTVESLEPPVKKKKQMLTMKKKKQMPISSFFMHKWLKSEV